MKINVVSPDLQVSAVKRIADAFKAVGLRVEVSGYTKLVHFPADYVKNTFGPPVVKNDGGHWVTETSIP